LYIKFLGHEKLIYPIKDNDFIKVIFQEMNLIIKKKYENYQIKNKLSSLKKSSSENRENNFNHFFLD